MDQPSQQITLLIKRLKALLPQAMSADRRSASREIDRITGMPKPSAAAVLQKLFGLEKRLILSAEIRKQRKARLPRPSYDSSLPIIAKKDEIIHAIKGHSVIVVSGETGSGKTTQLPKFCLEAGRGVAGIIGCTQPRRIAAVTVAHRIAEELGEAPGRSVGYKIRFHERFNKDQSYIKVMTDGILLAELQHDRYLNAYDTLIVDEAHERSLNIDFILGVLRGLLKKRKGLKLIITSATIDTEKFSEAFDHAPIIEVSGRMYPVEVHYLQDTAEGDADESTYVEKAVEAVDRIAGKPGAGDMLVFLPTEQDIRESCEVLEGRKYRATKILPLFGRLSAADQMKVFAPFSGRKIIVATNVAETSITVPGIRYVIDTGLARISRYDPRSRTTALPILPISKSSADQRKGRCGRMENGVCFRLYSEADYNGRERFASPEILRANLSEVILRMTALKLGDVKTFPFIDPPPAKQIKDGFDLLVELGAIEPVDPKKKAGARFRLTPQGRLMAKIPIDPRLSRMLIEADRRGCLNEVAVIASGLTIADPRERPEDDRDKADAAHARFVDPASDFISLYRIWEACFKESGSEKPFIRARDLKSFCKTNYLSFKRMREWQDVHEQVLGILEESGLDLKAGPRPLESVQKENGFSPFYTAVHQSILSGFLTNIAQKKEKNIYQAAKQREVMIFPGSGLFNKAGAWVVSAEMVETSRLFARTVANIDSAWLEPLGGSLCRRSYSNPRWERRKEAVVADEQVRLFGLIIVSKRPVLFGSVDPDAATDIFIRSALLMMDVKHPLPFMVHNRSLINSVDDIENRIRRRDLLVSEASLLAFYKEKLGVVYDMATLRRRIKAAGGDGFLRMQLSDVLAVDPDQYPLSLFPNAMPLGPKDYALSYRFEPGGEKDGVTVKLPVFEASTVPVESMDWIVPGLLEEKITALIKGLPKTYRKQLVPVSHTIGVIMQEMPKYRGSLIGGLSRFIHERFGVDIPASVWSEKDLPDHLRMRISLIDAGGRELCGGRDTGILQRVTPADLDAKEFEAERKKREMTGVTSWVFSEIPRMVSVCGSSGNRFPAYLGLEKQGDCVNLRLFKDPAAADASHRQGVGQLYRLRFSKEMRFLNKFLTLSLNKEAAVLYFGGRDRVAAYLADRVVSDLFCRDIRTKEEFDAHAEAAACQVLPAGRNLMAQVVPVLTAYAEARSRLKGFKTASAENPLAISLLCELEQALSRLVPERFIEIYRAEQMPHLVRYIQAIMLRAERGVADMEKDRVKAARVTPFINRLNDIIAGLNAKASLEKREAVEGLFWMIEEYKVSVFAQELKTAHSVSPKKLDERIKQIERMI